MPLRSWLSGRVRGGLEKILSARIYRVLPRGVDAFHDVRLYLPNVHIETMFDVGANVGQSVQRYVREFPLAHVFCFEPVSASFQELQRTVEGLGKVSTFRLALGEAADQADVVLEGTSDRFRLQQCVATARSASDPAVERVAVETLDGFCSGHDIARISYVKIDTEGHDLKVLKGSQRMLADQRIDILEVEAGMNRNNQFHVPFEAFHRFLGDRDYFLFGIYDQVSEFPSNAPHLRRTNALFISSQVINANTGAL